MSLNALQMIPNIAAKAMAGKKLRKTLKKTSTVSIKMSKLFIFISLVLPSCRSGTEESYYLENEGVALVRRNPFCLRVR